ncbi:hypothetical protein BJY04DRAFT_226454 [Aspergillus karnatakaensis]|uniref:tetratricopeptide repeat protein n=1 Tax=Aspergillus karnatakaensis TaxID=1810916 RepID=UPI003CCD0158
MPRKDLFSRLFSRSAPANEHSAEPTDPPPTTIGPDILALLNAGTDNPPDSDETEDETDDDSSSAAQDSTLQEAKAYIAAQKNGRLRISLKGPTRKSTKVSARVSLHGEDEDQSVHEPTLKSEHPAFDLYRKTKKFLRPNPDDGSTATDHEESLYFDCESDPAYHHPRPGTLTVHGYALERWDHEERFGSGQGELQRKFLLNTGPLVDPEPGQLFRRLDELRKGSRVLGERKELDDADVVEFIGQAAMDCITSAEKDVYMTLVTLLAVLNRRDEFWHFGERMSVAQEWTGVATERSETLGLWSFLWQMVITGEIARRLDSGEAWGASTGLTAHVLASLMVYDLWMGNVEWEISEDLPLPAARVVSAGERLEAVEMNALAVKQMEEEPDVAADLLEKAVAIDPMNIFYRIKRCHALSVAADNAMDEGDQETAEELYVEAVVEAKYITLLAPSHNMGWLLYAKAQLARGATKKALAAYEKAASLPAPEEDTQTFKERIVETKMDLVQEFLAATSIADPVRQHKAIKEINNWDYDIVGNMVRWHSKVHERQEEGLVAFAEAIKWPYVEEARVRITALYERLQAGKEPNLMAALHDWLYGIVLPGKYFAYTIMNCLVLCSQTVASIGAAPPDLCGLRVDGVTYWRTNSVLGRVLGASTGISSLNGWLGPCPSVNSSNGDERAAWLIVEAKRISANSKSKTPNPKTLALNEDEDPSAYKDDTTDPETWAIPQQPVHESTKYIIKSINLKAMEENKYQAGISFDVNKSSQFEVLLDTNPAFVSLPPCHPANAAGHAVHSRELDSYALEACSPESLMDENTFSTAGAADITVINATGDGAETMARAVCAFRGLNAAIRGTDGPCFACAVHATRSMRLDGLVWCG